MKIFLVALLGCFILNPRLVVKRESPSYLISCSTGWSLHWEGLRRGSGLLGVYSPVNAAWSQMSVKNDSKKKITEQIETAKILLMKACS